MQVRGDSGLSVTNNNNDNGGLMKEWQVYQHGRVRGDWCVVTGVV
jgi:hypothetical protein